MHDYTELRRRLCRPVSQTLDAPITLFEIWELSEVFVALSLILVLGVVFYEWLLLCLSLTVTLGGLPYLRRNCNKGMVFHWPYSQLGMKLLGMVNPGSRRSVSD